MSQKHLNRVPWRSLMVVLALVLAWTLGPGAAASSPADHDAALAVQWFELQLRLAEETAGFSPPVAARAFGYTGVTLYEAVVHGMPDHQSLVGQLNGLVYLPQPLQAQTYHWPAVANAALASITRALYANTSPSNHLAIDRLETQLDGSFAEVADAVTLERSRVFGRELADAVWRWSMSDGGHEGYNHNFYEDFVPPSGSGLWVPTPHPRGQPLPPLQPHWGENRPFVLASGKECAPPAPQYSEDPDSVFFRQALEVYETVKEVTPEQREIALFWSDDAGQTATPAGHWISILTQLIKERGDALGFAAVAYAKLGMVTSDAFIACWRTKYQYNLLRPVTYIRALIDPGWNAEGITDPLVTPPFPEYTSGHSVQSAAAATVLTELFGEDFAFTDRTHVWRGYAPRPYPSFMAAAEEAALSRLYGGIHYRAAIKAGLAQGQCIGERINALELARAAN